MSWLAALGLAILLATGGSSSSGGGGARVTSSGGYSPPKVGSTVVVSRATSTRPAQTAKVPPVQTTGTTSSQVGRSTSGAKIGTPYSPSGYTTPGGRPTTYSPVTHTYVVQRTYFYSGWGLFDGYYGCLYCWSGPYAYAPVPLPYAPAAWTQPPLAFDFEMLFLLVAIVLGLLLLGRAWGRRRSEPGYSYGGW